MTTKTSHRGNYILADNANSALASMPSDKRPELSDRRRIRSVAYCAGGKFEATSEGGSLEYMTHEQVAAIAAS